MGDFARSNGYFDEDEEEDDEEEEKGEDEIDAYDKLIEHHPFEY